MKQIGYIIHREGERSYFEILRDSASGKRRGKRTKKG